MSFPQVEESLFYHEVLYTHLTKDCVNVKANLDNYDGLADPRKHVQKVRNILKLVTIESDVMCKIFPITFHESARVWYRSFKSGFILSLYDFCVKFISHFSTNNPFKKSTHSSLPSLNEMIKT